METKELIKNLGTNITMCFLEGCPRADKCIRHLVYELLGEPLTTAASMAQNSLRRNNRNLLCHCSKGMATTQTSFSTSTFTVIKP